MDCLQKVFPVKAVEKMYKERLAMLKKFAKGAKNKTTLKSKDQFMKEKREEYRKYFCNPGCKNTFYEAQPKRPLNRFQRAIRKDIFGNNKNVLEDDFYKGLNRQTRKKLKNHGAISGCMKAYKNKPPL